MKKISAYAAACLIAFTSLAGCQTKAPAPEAEKAAENGGKMTIVTTIFPEYDWVRNVLGEEADTFDVQMLLGNGVDLHSYQPTVDDIMKISECDMFVYVGGESNAWVTDALKEAANSDMVVVDLLDVLGDRVREEEIVEGMHAEEEHSDDAGEDEGPEYDEHVWLSLKNAEQCVLAIADSVSKLDPDNREIYESNAGAYTEKLKALDQEYEEAVSAGKTDTLLFGDRFPFRYLVEDYGLKYYAAFAGCSAETEASFETIIFLAEKVDELGLECVLTIDNSDQKIAQTIVQNTKNGDQKILTLDSMQAATYDQAAGGTEYISVMESNLSVLKEALS